MDQQAIESPLFAALDDEKEAEIADAIQSTLLALENAQCPQQPARWLRVCSAVVLSEAINVEPRSQESHEGDEAAAAPVEEESQLERRASETSATGRGASSAGW